MSQEQVRWELVNGTCHRLPVPGGWLYKTWNESPFLEDSVVPGTVCVVFVPQPPPKEDR